MTLEEDRLLLRTWIRSVAVLTDHIHGHDYEAKSDQNQEIHQ
jgi:hypothetical protein